MREGEKTKLSAADYNHSAAAAHCDTQHGSDEFLQRRPEDTQFQLDQLLDLSSSRTPSSLCSRVPLSDIQL